MARKTRMDRLHTFTSVVLDSQRATRPVSRVSIRSQGWNCSANRRVSGPASPDAPVSCRGDKSRDCTSLRPRTACSRHHIGPLPRVHDGIPFVQLLHYYCTDGTAYTTNTTTAVSRRACSKPYSGLARLAWPGGWHRLLPCTCLYTKGRLSRGDMVGSLSLVVIHPSQPSASAAYHRAFDKLHPVTPFSP